MPEYVFLIRDHSGEVTGQERTDLASDVLALQRARELRDGHTIEVRRGDIWVASVSAKKDGSVGLHPLPEVPSSTT